MSTARPFTQVDVFAEAAYRGNPVAVIHDADGLDTDEMQRVARWTNLSETTFLLAPDDPGADYAVRIFTPASELPFAGHPTLGSCHAWLGAGGAPAATDVVVQECGAGLVSIRRAGARLAFAGPPLVRSGPVDEAFVARIAGMLRIGRDEVVDAAWVGNGPGWVAVLLADAGAVLALEPGFVDVDLGVVGLYLGVVGPYREGADAAIEVRAFFPHGAATAEDPVTGSLNASLADWLIDTGRLQAPYVASQGTALGRAGRVHVERGPDGTTWVGGHTTTCIRGTITV